MPEGPEIKLAADKLAKALVGNVCKEIFFAFPRLKKFERRLHNVRLVSIEPRGKAILTTFENGLVIYSHNQLYGKWLVCKPEDIPVTNRQMRLTIETENSLAILYSASDIHVLNKGKLFEHPFLAKLGPDLLSENPSVVDIFQRLKSKRFVKKRFAGLLLDQGFVAGLGNYLRAEILFYAKLHPTLRAFDCCDVQLKLLAKTILSITRRAYKKDGVINPPALVKKLKSAGKKHKEQYRFAVYGRQSLACYTCSSKIIRENIGGRHIYFCPSCQSN